MRRFFACCVFTILSGPVAYPQADLKERLRPVTAPIRHAGVFHVATGTWTRGAKLSSLTGPDVVYNNTCAVPYYLGQLQGDKLQHRSRLPSPTGPITGSSFYGAPRNDEAPGCQTSYTIDGFEIAYCSLSLVSVDYLYEFADSYLHCEEQDMVPTHAVSVTGMPGGSATGALRCWTLDIDLSGAEEPLVLQADGDGVWTGPSTAEQFGWSLGPTSAADATGPVIAGNYTWTGGEVGKLTPCTGTDGSIWDVAVNLAEAGTGMASNDFFRVIPPPIATTNCYFFGGQPHGDFYLRLFADAGCAPGVPMASFCHPGLSGVAACPCGNPPADVGRGCDNSSATGGATLGASGYASLSADTVVFTTQAGRSSALSILAQGDAALGAGTVYGQGIRCVGGALKRLFTRLAFNGSITVPQPGDPTVSARSAAKGDVIGAGTSRFYFVYYRDPTVLGGCPASSTFNTTQGGRIPWSM